ncbi:hypothetical protein C6341_g5322 [Phytophthora cactorum]|nr:hypothetical protein PC120_g4603 [Phytophthora cactorum]KAG3183803.1 hypothetical protein C6341_g5322 [Phytophthora cactorum]
MPAQRGPIPVTCRLELLPRGVQLHNNVAITANPPYPESVRWTLQPYRRYPNVITNDLDEAQSRQLSTEPNSQGSNRPVTRPLTLPSRRDCGFQSLDPAETARRTALQLLDTYVCGPAAATADQQVRRHTLRERFLTQQATTPGEYR